MQSCLYNIYVGLSIITASRECFTWHGRFVCACGQNPALDSSVASFEQFGFHKQLLSGLAEMNYQRPTTVQVLL